MKIKLLSIINLIVTLLLIYWNYLSNTGIIGGKTIGDLSAKYSSLFTPAGYAFAIWGIIFLGLIAFAVFAIYLAFKESSEGEFLEKALPNLIAVNLLNGAWVYLWLTENIGLSVVCMIFIFLGLLKMTLQMQMNVSKVSKKVNGLAHWPIGIYFGWIMVALVANISAYLNFNEFSLGFKESSWAIAMIGVVTLINYLLVRSRNQIQVALVAIWALLAIAVRHWSNDVAIAYPAILAAIFLLGTVLYRVTNLKTSR